MKTAQLVDEGQNVQIAVVNSQGKPTMVRVSKAEAIKLSAALRELLGLRPMLLT